jgi:hypothetical protein
LVESPKTLVRDSFTHESAAPSCKLVERKDRFAQSRNRFGLRLKRSHHCRHGSIFDGQIRQIGHDTVEA